MAILEVQDLHAGYGDVQILWGANLQLEKGKMTCIVGTNGAGKTTALRAVMGLLKPWSGSVIFDGKDITKLSAHEKAERGLILVPEGRHLFTDMSVEENLEMGSSPIRSRPQKNKNYELVYEIFPRLKERRDQKAGTLSGGEQQMLAVARGIMGSPIILMMDELSLGLAPVLVLNLFESLGLLKDAGITMLLVEQNVQMALAVSDYGYVFSHGKVTLDGTAAQLMEDEHVKAAYLGM
jgi:branched-chain amino acid transport system ATP-binding protein